MDNIRYGRLDATDEECMVAAKLANADGFIRRLPDGYNTMLTGDGANLSQGQRQLLAIARAAVADPPVLILDEATSSIDTRTEALVQAGMDGLMYGRTTFVIAHRLSTVRNADCIIVLEQGRIHRARQPRRADRQEGQVLPALHRQPGRINHTKRFPAPLRSGIFFAFFWKKRVSLFSPARFYCTIKDETAKKGIMREKEKRFLWRTMISRCWPSIWTAPSPTIKRIITPRTRAALDAALTQGVTIVLASGRPTAGVMPVAQDLGLGQPGRAGAILAYNGGAIVDCAPGGRVLWQQVPARPYGAGPCAPLPPARTWPSLPTTMWASSPSARRPLGPAGGLYHKLPMVQVDDLPAYVNYPVNKMLITLDPVRLQPVLLAGQERFCPGRSTSILPAPFSSRRCPWGWPRTAALPPCWTGWA